MATLDSRISQTCGYACLFAMFTQSTVYNTPQSPPTQKTQCSAALQLPGYHGNSQLPWLQFTAAKSDRKRRQKIPETGEGWEILGVLSASFTNGLSWVEVGWSRMGQSTG